MPAERDAFRLGAALIVFFTLFVGVLFFLAPRGGGDMPLKVRFRHTELNTILKPGGLVRCGGETVGSIRALELREMNDPETGQPMLYTVITCRVDSAVGLRADCKIVPVGPLLGEGGQLVIRDRGVGRPLAEGEMIDGVPGASLANLMDAVSAQLDERDPTSLLGLIRAQLDPGGTRSIVGKILRSLEDINSLTRNVSRQFDPDDKAALLAKLHRIMDDVNQTTRLLRDQMDREIDETLLAKLHASLDTLQSGLHTVEALLKENRPVLTETVAHVRNTSAILERQIAARIAAQLDVADASSLIAKVHVSLDRLGRSLNDLNAITAHTRDLVLLNKNRIDGMVANFKQTSDHLKAAAKEIRVSPWRLFYQPTEKELAQSHIFDAARAFSEAAGHLDDVVTRIQSIQQAGGPPVLADDEELDELRQQLQDTFARFTEVEHALWNALDIK